MALRAKRIMLFFSVKLRGVSASSVLNPCGTANRGTVAEWDWDVAASRLVPSGQAADQEGKI